MMAGAGDAATNVVKEWLARERRDHGPVWARCLSGVGFSIATVAQVGALAATPLIGAPAAATAVAFTTALATLLANGATQKIPPLEFTQANHELRRVFETMVAKRLGMLTGSAVAEAEAYGGLKEGELPPEIARTLGPKIASLVGAMAATEFPTDEGADLPPVLWAGENDWRELLRPLGQEAHAPAFHARGLWWFLFEARHDGPGLAALEQYLLGAMTQALDEHERRSGERHEEVRTAIEHSRRRAEEQTQRLEKALKDLGEEIARDPPGFELVQAALDSDPRPTGEEAKRRRREALHKGPSWDDVRRGYVFERTAQREVWRKLSGWGGLQIVTLSGPSGTGKSTFLMWLAVQLCARQEWPVLYTDFGENAVWLPKSLQQGPAVLAIDRASLMCGGGGTGPQDFIDYLQQEEFQGIVLLADQDVTWALQEMADFAREHPPISLGRLDDQERRRLDGLLGLALGEGWTAKPEEERKEILSDPEGGELLVVLVQAVTGQSLTHYVTGELESFRRTCESRGYSPDRLLDAITVISWMGYGDRELSDERLKQACPEVNLRALERLGGSIVVRRGEGWGNRHRLFAQAILKERELERTEALGRLFRAGLTGVEAVRLARGGDLDVELLLATVDHSNGDERVLQTAIWEAFDAGEAGLPVIKRAVEISEGNKWVLQTAVRAAAWAGEAGLPAIERAFELSGGDTEVLKVVTWAAARAGEAGLPAIERAFEISGGDAGVLREVTRAAGLRGGAGLPVVERVIELSGGDMEVLRMAAVTASWAGDMGRATLAFLRGYVEKLPLAAREGLRESLAGEPHLLEELGLDLPERDEGLREGEPRVRGGDAASG